MFDFRKRMRLAPATAGALAFLLTATAPRYARAVQVHYRIDPATSVITASVAQPLVSVRGNADGTFKIIDGEIFLDPVNPAATGSVKLIIDAGSYHSDKEARDRDITSQLLEVDKYPTIKFESVDLTNVVRSSETDGTATIDGSLTLHGQTHPVSVPVEVEVTADYSKAITEGELTLHYPDWGISVPSLMLMKAGDDATITFHVTAHSVP
jgi:polyisoprenoid-binding protein YceI